MTTTTLDFDGFFTVDGYRGVAFVVLGHATSTVLPDPILDCPYPPSYDCNHDDVACWIFPEVEEVEEKDWVRVVMVGDDTVHIVETSDLTPLHEEGFCHGCGQTGCGH